MSINDYKVAFFIAYKTVVKGSKSVSALLIIVLSLVFFNLLFIQGFLAGFSTGVLQSMIDTSSAHIILLPEEKPLHKKYIVNQEKLRKQVETIPGVLATTRHYLLSGSVAFDKDKTGQLAYVAAPIVGFNQREERQVMKIRDKVISGDFPDELRDDEIMIGTSLAGGYDDTVQNSDLGGARAGDKVHVVYANGIEKTYTVRGVFQVTIGFVGSNAFISDKEAERILSAYDQASEILIRTDLARAPVTDYVAKIRAIAPTLKIDTYTKRLSAVGTLIEAFDVIAFIIGIITILVAAATIFIMIYINALSRKKQIGILKAIGIRDINIEFSYVFQALFFSLCAVVIGSAVFYGIARPYLLVNPIKMPYGDALLVITNKEVMLNGVYMIIAAIIAGFVSSRLISKKQIVETIWG